MLSNRSYLLKAFYQWIVDSDCTPILVLNAEDRRCKVPKEFIEDGEIVFNIAPSAIRSLEISYDTVQFKASFSGVIHVISAPMSAVNSVYAEENGEGIFFDEEDDDAAGGDDAIVQLRAIDGSSLTSDKAVDHDAVPASAQTNKSKPFLRIVE